MGVPGASLGVGRREARLSALLGGGAPAFRHIDQSGQHHSRSRQPNPPALCSRLYPDHSFSHRDLLTCLDDAIRESKFESKDNSFVSSLTDDWEGQKTKKRQTMRQFQTESSSAVKFPALPVSQDFQSEGSKRSPQFKYSSSGSTGISTFDSISVLRTSPSFIKQGSDGNEKDLNNRKMYICQCSLPRSKSGVSEKISRESSDICDACGGEIISRCNSLLIERLPVVLISRPSPKSAESGSGKSNCSVQKHGTEMKASDKGTHDIAEIHPVSGTTSENEQDDNLTALTEKFRRGLFDFSGDVDMPKRSNQTGSPLLESSDDDEDACKKADVHREAYIKALAAARLHDKPLDLMYNERRFTRPYVFSYFAPLPRRRTDEDSNLDLLWHKPSLSAEGTQEKNPEKIIFGKTKRADFYPKGSRNYAHHIRSLKRKLKNRK